MVVAVVVVQQQAERVEAQEQAREVKGKAEVRRQAAARRRRKSDQRSPLLLVGYGKAATLSVMHRPHHSGCTEDRKG